MILWWHIYSLVTFSTSREICTQFFCFGCVVSSYKMHVVHLSIWGWGLGCFSKVVVAFNRMGVSPMTSQLNGCPHFFVFLFHIFFLKLIVALDCVLSMREKIMIPMYRLIITQLIWTTWTSLSTVWERPLNLLVHITFLQNSIFRLFN